MDRESQNRAIRVRLAAAYRAVDSYGLNEGITNHLTALAPSVAHSGDVMLLIPFGLPWSEVKPSDLIGINDQNEVVEGEGAPARAALCLHRAIYRRRRDIKAVMHTHMPYATALSCLDDPRLQMLHQHSTQFLNYIAYDDSYWGLFQTSDACEKISDALADKSVLLMRNHGVLTAAETVDLAFHDMYYLEKAAKIEVLARSMQCPLKKIDTDVIETTSTDLLNDRKKYAKCFMDSIIYKLSRSCSEFKK